MQFSVTAPSESTEISEVTCDVSAMRLVMSRVINLLSYTE